MPFRCLVVCPLPIVAEDLAEIIRDRLGPDAARICLDPAIAADMLAGLPAPVVVFALVRSHAMAALGLDRAVERHGARLVVVGATLDSAAAAARGWYLLPEPFSSEMVEEMLARLGG